MKGFSLIFLLSLPVSVLACDPMPPHEAFIYENDLNHDDKLNRLEWQQAKKTANYVLDSNQSWQRLASFKFFDKNHNGYLTANELAVGYKTDPCASWNQMVTNGLNHNNK